MKRAYICDTPFQLFNVLNIAYHESKEEADVYLVDQFDRAKDLYDFLKKDNLFTNVFLVQIDSRGNMSTLKWYMKRIFSYLCPRRTIKRNIGIEQYKIFNKTKYDFIMAGTVSCFVSCICRVKNNAQFDLIDDGTGSYSNDIVNDSIGNLHKVFSKVFGVGSGAIHPEVLYVNSVQNCKSTAAKKIKSLPHIDEKFLEYACKVYNYDFVNSNTGRRIIWLTQPNDGYDRINDAVKDVLKTHKEEILVRMHPREIKPERYSPLILDKRNVMWELEVAFHNIDSWILISNFSSAQLTPKLLYDKEPVIIFLYPIYKEMYSKQKYMSLKDTVEEFKNTYKNPEKVFVVKSIAELQRTIGLLKNVL